MAHTDATQQPTMHHRYAHLHGRVLALLEMSRLLLPQGQSVRQVAERLGVSVDELLRHSGVRDAEAPLPAARSIDVPDGFLRSRAKSEDIHDAITSRSAKKGGMNTWLALDIEHKRTRAAGGLRAHDASGEENLALEEARRAYLRFENESNELAVSLYAQASITPSVDVRARAFAGQAMALAQRCRTFGEPAQKARAQAISLAKAALLADPKLADAHLAVALALLCGATPDDRREALAELEEAASLDARSAFAWAELAELLLGEGDPDGASVALAHAQAAGECVRAAEVAGWLALGAKAASSARRHFEAALALAPTYIAPQIGLARAHAAAGDAASAARELEAALARAHSDTERAFLRRIYHETR
jgi:tetratricopeptide (TPR) repeat protein